LPTPWLRSSNQPQILPPRPLRLLGGASVAIGVAALVMLVLWSIANAAYVQPQTGAPLPDVAHLLRMSAIQSGLSTILSLLIGTALAWALNRLKFRGRGLVIGLFASAIVTPGLIVAFGLLTVWGRSGWVNAVAEAVFHTRVDVPIFGLAGILAAHVILNAAFAARILLARLDAIPVARLKTGQSLALSATRRFAVIDWPALRGTLPGLGAIIFLLAFTSFPIVLLLGGGPANQTLEVAIYSAVRLDFNLHGAVILALVQIGFCAIIIFATSAFAPIPSTLGPGASQNWSDRWPARAAQWFVLVACLIGFALPLLAVLAGGFSGNILALFARPAFASAVATSLTIGMLSALLTLSLALGLGAARAATSRHLLRIGLAAPAYAYLAVPAVVLAVGFFLLVRNMRIEPATAGPAVVILANALLALPFAVATLGPPLEAVSRTKGKLIRSLGLSGWRQFALVEWPLLGREIGVVLALAFCFSLGDLGVISLFGTQDFSTLPLMLVRALGAYRTNDAAIIAALMLVITVAAFTALPPLFARWSDAQA
jgi:thiamine transport system permease protein